MAAVETTAAGKPAHPPHAHRERPSPFASILFDVPASAEPTQTPEPPDYFADLHLDEVVDAILAGRDEYRLTGFFQSRLAEASTISYRHEIFRDLERPAPASAVRSFADEMKTVRGHLDHATKVHYRYEQQRWFLDAALAYCTAVAALVDALATTKVGSAGLNAFRKYAANYVASDAFARLSSDVERVRAALGSVSYRLRMKPGQVTVSLGEGEPDFGAEVLETFEKFKQGAGKAYPFEFTWWPDMNHVEAAILERVALLFPAIFAALDGFHAEHRQFIDPTIERFDREIQFYLAYLEYADRIRARGLLFCYPEIVGRAQETRCRDVFDLALAGVLLANDRTVVTNDFHLRDPERILVVSGPNQGGKTTFARTVGQLHHLAAIGVPTPGSQARLHLVDRIFTHFERVEEVEDLASKLEADLRRIHAILGLTTSDSLIIMNESFSSTTLDDQSIINKQVLRAIIRRGALCVAVTFLDELASLDQATVSMVSNVDPEEPARRTFKIERRPADGLAYAMAIAEKHRLTFRRLRQRLGR